MRRIIPKEIRVRAIADYLDGVRPEEIRKRYKLGQSDVNNLWRRAGYVSQTKMRELRMWDRACGRSA